MPRTSRAGTKVETEEPAGASRERNRRGPADEAAFARQPLAYSANRLAEVSREIGDWVPVLRRLAETEVLRDLALGHCTELSAASVRSIIAARRLRDEYFWPSMAEAAWALLLQLFATRLEGRYLDVSGLSEATGLPIESARHWVDWLAGRGMICRAGEGEEGEATPIDLSEAGADEMRAYLLASLRLSPLGTVKSRDIIKALKKAGWTEARHEGSHKQFRHPKTAGTVTVPHPKADVAIGTLKSIERQSGLKLR